MKLCGFEVGNDQPIFLIAGTCVVESEAMAIDTAGTLTDAARVCVEVEGASSVTASLAITSTCARIIRSTGPASPHWRRRSGCSSSS